MICVSIGNRTYSQIIDILDRPEVEMAEIRLDLCELTDEEIEDLFANSDTPLIATERGGGRRLKLAIEAGARFADMEIEAPAQTSRDIQKLCAECGTELIRSYHDFNGTSSDEHLQKILARCFRYGADIVKIVTSASSEEDSARLLSLYGVILEGVDSLEGRLIAFTMGEHSRDSRLECLRRGAPFTYAALSEEEKTAPGQWSLEEMRRALYSDRRPVRASGLKMPSSKSFAQRAIIAAALSDGESILEDYSSCSDSQSAISVARSLGAEVSLRGDALHIRGNGTRPLALKELNVGESGLLARLMIPLASALGEGPVEIYGERTLLERPLSGAVNIMASFGVLVSALDGGRQKEVHVPVRVSGKLLPGTADVSGKGGSQLISGLLMALPLCDAPTKLFVGEPKSIPYMYVTQDVMGRFGVKVSCEMEGDAQLLQQGDWSSCTGMTFKIPGGQRFRPARFKLESDWSAAANFLVAGAVFGSVSIDNLDTSSVQADISIMDILVEAGAIVSETEAGCVCVRKAPLEAFRADMNHCPDLFPIVSVLAAFCAGESRLSGISRLAGKESDRAGAIVDMLLKMGVEAEISEDDLVIQGESLSARLLRAHLLKGGEYSSRHDHRMLMALKVASLAAESPFVIDDQQCVSKSFPGFNDIFSSL